MRPQAYFRTFFFELFKLCELFKLFPRRFQESKQRPGSDYFHDAAGNTLPPRQFRFLEMPPLKLLKLTIVVTAEVAAKELLLTSTFHLSMAPPSRPHLECRHQCHTISNKDDSDDNNGTHDSGNNGGKNKNENINCSNNNEERGEERHPLTLAGRGTVDVSGQLRSVSGQPVGDQRPLTPVIPTAMAASGSNLNQPPPPPSTSNVDLSLRARPGSTPNHTMQNNTSSRIARRRKYLKYLSKLFKNRFHSQTTSF